MVKRSMQFLSHVTVGLLVLIVQSWASERRLLIREFPRQEDGGLKAGNCHNTGIGRLWLADSKGMVCSRSDLDYGSGCCKSGEQYQCESCKMTDQCCAEYEHCVSCCQDPKNGADKLYSMSLRSPKYPAAGTWLSVWDYCRGVCRTHGRSTAHENSYISTRHHCFSQLGKPMLSDPLPPGALDGVTVTLSQAGESCDAACQRVSLTCSVQHFSVLNSCDRLREHVACEAGCEAGALPGGSSPAYMEPTTPKAGRPAMCFVSPLNAPAPVNCNSKDTHAQRLCPCKSA